MDDVKQFFRSVCDDQLQNAEGDLRNVLLRIVDDKLEAAKTVVSKDFENELNTQQEDN